LPLLIACPINDGLFANVQMCQWAIFPPHPHSPFPRPFYVPILFHLYLLDHPRSVQPQWSHWRSRKEVGQTHKRRLMRGNRINGWGMRDEGWGMRGIEGSEVTHTRIVGLTKMFCHQQLSPTEFPSFMFIKCITKRNREGPIYIEGSRRWRPSMTNIGGGHEITHM
jgi:hypothetical protein